MILKRFLRTFALAGAALVVAQFGGACKIDIPTEFPTLPPKPIATPLATLEYKRDPELEKTLARIAEAARGKVGVAAVALDTGDAAFLNPDEHFPMQSVYKLPISMAVANQVRLGSLDFDEKIGVTKDDMVRPGVHSPLRDANPDGGEFTIRELVRLALVESDGTASDVLMRVAGGPTDIQSFLTQIGIRDMKIVSSEKEMATDWQIQYQNYSTPIAAAELLRWVDAGNSVGFEDDGKDYAVKDENRIADSLVEPLTEIQTLVKFMAESNPGAKRLKGSLPAGTFVAHKTGTSGTQNGVTAATNDIGIVELPDGKRFVIAVFVSDSPAGEKIREEVIAQIAKAVWERFARSNSTH